LAAIGAVQSMGAIVRAFDTRPAVKDEVRSLGAEFLELELEEDGAGSGGYAKEMSAAFLAAEMALFQKQAEEVDIIITTAAIPGRPAPKLITEQMVRSMRPGSVVVDLAAETGGNCELTQPGEVAQVHGVTIIGTTNLPSRLPTQSSQLYSNNLLRFLQHLGDAESFQLDLEDEITRAVTVTHQGETLWPPPAPEPPAPPQRPETASASSPPEIPTPEPIEPSLLEKFFNRKVGYVFAALLVLLIGAGGSSEFLSHLTVFVLACFVGYMVVWNVAPSLHTPLMSATNAISGIIVLGGIIHLAGSSPLLSALAVLIATVNIVGGFMVTHRMLGMFRK